MRRFALPIRQWLGWYHGSTSEGPKSVGRSPKEGSLPEDILLRLIRTKGLTEAIDEFLSKLPKDLDSTLPYSKVDAATETLETSNLGFPPDHVFSIPLTKQTILTLKEMFDGISTPSS